VTQSASFDAAALLAEYQAARLLAQQQACWDEGDPTRPLKSCRYCGKTWQPFAGSRLDGHAACLIGEGFKQRVGDLLRLPTVTYAGVAEALGITSGVVRSWAYAAGVAGPVSHSLRRSGLKDSSRRRAAPDKGA
jgi:hypothetical protein